MKKAFSRLFLFRIVLGILILMNLLLIYNFSSENGEQSTESSTTVTEQIAETVIPGFNERPIETQQQIVSKMQPVIRKLAHMTEFGTLAALVFLFLSTWRINLAIRFAVSVSFSFLYACTDEFHQRFSPGRGPQFTDVLIDTCGAFLASTLLLCIFLIASRRKKRKAVPHGSD